MNTVYSQNGEVAKDQSLANQENKFFKLVKKLYNKKLQKNSLTGSFIVFIVMRIG